MAVTKGDFMLYLQNRIPFSNFGCTETETRVAKFGIGFD